MRTPVHAPSARLSRAAGPMPPRSSARRVLRPLPTPRKRRGEAMAERHSAIDTTTPPFEGRWGAGDRERHGFPGPIRASGGLGPYEGSPEIEERHGFPGPIRASGGLLRNDSLDRVSPLCRRCEGDAVALLREGLEGTPDEAILAMRVVVAGPEFVIAATIGQQHVGGRQ